MSIHVVTVFGGTGFLGRRVVRHLRKHEFSNRIASRHPDRSCKLFGSDDPCLQSVEVLHCSRKRLFRTLMFAKIIVSILNRLT
jgi:nucleoside-diphosphate-sugar epimerase